MVENGTTLESGTKTVPKWGPSCGHENGSTLEPFQLHFFLSVNFIAYQNSLSEYSFTGVPASLYNLTKGVSDPFQTVQPGEYGQTDGCHQVHYPPCAAELLSMSWGHSQSKCTEVFVNNFRIGQVADANIVAE